MGWKFQNKKGNGRVKKKRGGSGGIKPGGKVLGDFSMKRASTKLQWGSDLEWAREIDCHWSQR